MWGAVGAVTLQVLHAHTSADHTHTQAQTRARSSTHPSRSPPKPTQRVHHPRVDVEDLEHAHHGRAAHVRVAVVEARGDRRDLRASVRVCVCCHAAPCVCHAAPCKVPDLAAPSLSP
jgi:hypothetical protein